MRRQNTKSWGLLALAISSIIVTFSGWQLVKAQSTPEFMISVEFPDAPERASSGRTTGGGTRGDSCTAGTVNLTALMPADNAVTTVASNPKFFVYVPENEADSAEFEISDKSDQRVYVSKLDISNTSGIVKLAIPTNVSLTTDEEYTWRFTIICDAWDHSGNKVVKGTIKKIEINSDLQKNLRNATTPLKQAEVYAEAKIWSETIATLADLRSSNPAAWTQLLTSVGLEEIASQPFAVMEQVKQTIEFPE